MGLLALGLFWVLLTGRDRGLRERRARKKAARFSQGLGAGALVAPCAGAGFPRAHLRGGARAEPPGSDVPGGAEGHRSSSAGTGKTILWVVLYNLIMFALAEVPIAGYLFAPEQTRDRVEAFNQWLGGHGRQIAMVLCGIGRRRTGPARAGRGILTRPAAADNSD